MPLINQTIPNLINGVSQQPAALRLPTQWAGQTNCYPSVVEGLKWRPPTEHVAKIMHGRLGNAFTHRINRDITERYFVIIRKKRIHVFDADGVEKTVATPDGVDYLNEASPKESFWAVTVADYTFVINKNKVVTMDAAVSHTNPDTGLVFVKKGEYGSNYRVIVDGVEKASKTTSDTVVSDLKTDTIAASLESQLVTNLGGGYTVTRSGPVIKIVKTTGTFSLQVEDSQGGVSLLAFKNKVQRFSLLPSVAPDGYVIEVDSDPDSDVDSYFVKFVVNNTGDSMGEGTWKETVAPGIPYKLNHTTMPHVLVRESDGTFTFRHQAWGDRVAGDEETAPEPSFVGRKLNDLFFFKNRLGLTSDENTIQSEVGEYFNFFPTTVTQTLDSDPIDSKASHTKVSNLRHAVPFNGSVVLFSDQTQFTLGSDGGLTFKTIKIDQTTEFETNLRTKPIAVGRSIFFVTNKGDFNGLREFFVDTNSSTGINDAVDATAHVPAYIPAGTFKLTASTVEDVLILLTEGYKPGFYLYKYYWDGSNKVQSAWVKCSVGDDETEVTFAEFIETTLYLLVQREDGVYLEKMRFEPGRVDPFVGYVTHLDRRITESELPSRVYDAPSDTTTFVLPYTIDGETTAVTRAKSTDLIGIGRALTVVSTLEGLPNVRERWGETAWSQSGVTAFVPKLVNDGDSTVSSRFGHVDSAGVGSYIQLDTGVGQVRAFQGCELYAVNTYKAIWSVQYSDDNALWTSAKTGWNAGSDGLYSTIHWPYVGAHRYWRLLKTDTAGAGAYLNEIQFWRHSTLTVRGNHSTTPLFIGQRMKAEGEFSKFYLRKQSQTGGMIVESSGRLQLRKMTVVYAKSGYFKFTVIPVGKPRSEYTFNGRIVGDSNNVIGKIALPSGEFSVPILSRNENVTIMFSTDSFLPFHLIQVKWEGLYQTKSQAV